MKLKEDMLDGTVRKSYINRLAKAKDEAMVTLSGFQQDEDF